MPTIVICGTPGTGKSTVVQELKKTLTDYKFFDLSEYAMDHKFNSDYDEELDTYEIDEDKLVEKLEPELEQSENNIIEYIHGDIIDPDLVDLVFVCRTDITKLYYRLEGRLYNEFKIQNNIDAEIFQTILDECIECYGRQKVTQLFNNTHEDLEFSVRLILNQISRLVEEDRS